jgi:hypothetical protein
MISERLAKIEDTIRNARDVPDATRKELLSLVADLKAEAMPFADSRGETAEASAGTVETSVISTVRRGEAPDKAAQVMAELADSVRAFEATHPRLVELVDQLALTLSNMGI